MDFLRYFFSYFIGVGRYIIYDIVVFCFFNVNVKFSYFFNVYMFIVYLCYDYNFRFGFYLWLYVMKFGVEKMKFDSINNSYRKIFVIFKDMNLSNGII